MTPEERSAYAKKLAAMRRPENMRRAYKRTRGPKGWSAEDAAAAKVAARLAAERLVERLIANGTIPRSDIDGANATVAALTLLAAPGGAKADKLAAARKLLRHYHADLAGMV
ncbi:hypothetical protein SZ64_09345 [Erythrobacter sp. SG61-1L]|nr:hypothetical protein SZ64_09345 [Erythrobacter sp. SG61-1L]